MAWGLQEKGGESYRFSVNMPLTQGVCGRNKRRKPCGLCVSDNIETKNLSLFGRGELLSLRICRKSLLSKLLTAPMHKTRICLDFVSEQRKLRKYLFLCLWLLFQMGNGPRKKINLLTKISKANLGITTCVLAALGQPCLGTERCRPGEEGFSHPKPGLVGQQHQGPETEGAWEGSPNFATFGQTRW